MGQQEPAFYHTDGDIYGDFSLSDYDVDSWVHQRLELDFNELKKGGHELHTFSPYSDTSSSSSLMSLRLTDVDIPEEILHYLLYYRILPNLSNLEIDVANLVSFEFCARELIANFEHVRSLAEMSIEGDYCMHVVYSLHQFSSFLPQLRTLKSNPMAVTVPKVVLNGISKFPNLKHLEMTFATADLDCYHLRVAFFESISFVAGIHIEGEYRSMGFEGRENAVRLEKMIIDPCKSHFMGSPMVWYCKRSKGYKCGRMCAIELAAKFPHLELVTPEIPVPLTDL
ncbi:hypothetical protein WN944_018058 [Citrus x changshan-huyou]|uniref:Uncharacterized protein n=1 Tax=Citrus x changshan-huyou TaxID=2935761 RepID=A0AAP0LW38_9ROSI